LEGSALVLSVHSSQPHLNPLAAMGDNSIRAQSVFIWGGATTLVLKASTRMLFAWGSMQKLRGEKGGSLTFSVRTDDG